MGILKSTHSGKSYYWKNILQSRGYAEVSTLDSIYEYKTLYWHCYKYPFTTNKDDSFILTESCELLTYIKYNSQIYFVKIKDEKHIELIEKYWDIKYDTDIRFVNMKNKLLKRIVEYVHS